MKFTKQDLLKLIHEAFVDSKGELNSFVTPKYPKKISFLCEKQCHKKCRRI